MQITETAPSKYTVTTCSQLTGSSPSEELDQLLTEKLN
uniref:Uncharacterized protein n=1 Tax=Caenorhabditis japonica TaxID=281687 RepID=A0A8R1EUG0_CAEJA